MTELVEIHVHGHPRIAFWPVEYSCKNKLRKCSIFSKRQPKPTVTWALACYFESVSLSLIGIMNNEDNEINIYKEKRF